MDGNFTLFDKFEITDNNGIEKYYFDDSQDTITVYFESTGDLNFNPYKQYPTPGHYTEKLIARDQYNNETSYEIHFNMIEDISPQERELEDDNTDIDTLLEEFLKNPDRE